MSEMVRWSKVGNAYRLKDSLSELWIRREGNAYVLLSRLSGPGDTVHGFSQLGTFRTLAEAKADGLALMKESE